MTEPDIITQRLAGFGPVLWINLDDDAERRRQAEELFDSHRIENRRISGFDGRYEDLSGHLEKGELPENLLQTELGCSLSHLKAIRHFLEVMEGDHVIICEDDILFETVNYWPFDWATFMSRLPGDWDCLQLAVTAPGRFTPYLHPRVCNYCTVCNVFTRKYAEVLAGLHFRGPKYDLNSREKAQAVADEMLFSSGKTYSMPLFVYRNHVSHIHQDHVEEIHQENVEVIMKFWREQGARTPIEALLPIA
jgi:hypothetical protein